MVNQHYFLLLSVQKRFLELHNLVVPHLYISWLFLPQFFDPGGVRDGVRGGYETWITVTPGQGAEQHLGKVLPQVGSSWVLNQVHLGQAVTGTQVGMRGVGSVTRPLLQP